MARVSAVIYKQFIRKDGTYNVRIKVFHKQIRKLIPTVHYISERNLNSDRSIKNPTLINLIERDLDEYRIIISNLGSKLEAMSCQDLVDYLESKDNIDFIKFCEDHIDQLKKDNRIGTANNHKAVKNSLIDYFGRKKIDVKEINANMLFKYNRYLRGRRKMERTNQYGNTVFVVKEGLSENGLYSHMRDLRTLFNSARSYYNNEDLNIIKIYHNPFKTYKVGSPPLVKNRNITIDQLKAIKNCKLESDSRAELARDLFMLSFYFCGMNAVDLYQITAKNLVNGRINYSRSKTTRLRKDDAFISIKLIKEAKPLFNKYSGILSFRYASSMNLDAALSKGMRELRTIAGVPDITFYYARHTFANLARNICRVSKDDLDLALNHIDSRHKLTDVYLQKDWIIIDDVQAKVARLLVDSN